MAENFGERMHRLRVERGQPIGGPGRTPRGVKYARQFAAVERTFAEALPAVAAAYVEELQSAAPERCPEHKGLLRCAEAGCGRVSERVAFDHKAASYVFDRLLGRPLTRSENTLAVRFVQELTGMFAGIFEEVNALDTPAARAERFALRLVDAGAAYETG